LSYRRRRIDRFVCLNDGIAGQASFSGSTRNDISHRSVRSALVIRPQHEAVTRFAREHAVAFHDVNSRTAAVRYAKWNVARVPNAYPIHEGARLRGREVRELTHAVDPTAASMIT
jgi:hypothetical protein